MLQENLNSVVALIPAFNIFDVIFSVSVAAILGLLISAIYRATYQGHAYSQAFVTTLIIITMVTAIVIMVIGNNLARAFGLVGAMSIIRFRTAVKDAKDIAFVFFALAAGLASGAGNHLTGITGVALISIFILLLHLFHYGSSSREELYLRFWMLPEEGDEPVYQNVFHKYFSSHKLLNIRSARLGEFLELSFSVQFKRSADHQNLVRDMSALEGIERVSLNIGESISE